jgi:hypothetical protein
MSDPSVRRVLVIDDDGISRRQYYSKSGDYVSRRTRGRASGTTIDAPRFLTITPMRATSNLCVSENYLGLWGDGAAVRRRVRK